MGHCIKQIIDKLGKIYKINLKGTVNYKLPNCTKLNDIILDVSGYGYYSSPKSIQNYWFGNSSTFFIKMFAIFREYNIPLRP